MRKDQILQIAISKNLKREQFGKGYKSAFGIIGGCMRSVSIMDLSEKTKKEKMIKNLQSYWNGQSSSVEGCKREDVQKIISCVFGIKSSRNGHLNAEIRAWSFSELYLYYCYIERIVKSDTYFLKYLSGEDKMKIKGRER